MRGGRSLGSPTPHPCKHPAGTSSTSSACADVAAADSYADSISTALSTATAYRPGLGWNSAICTEMAANSGLPMTDCHVSTESSSATLMYRKRACGPSALCSRVLRYPPRLRSRAST